MNLKKKKQLAAKTLEVGKNRIIFNQEGLSEIKEAITRQDIRDLFSQGIITIKPIKGRKKLGKRKTKRGYGKIKMKINKRKQNYVKITRKLRKYLKEMKNKGFVNRDLYKELRKKIKMRAFKSKTQFKEYMDNLKLVSKTKIDITENKKEKRKAGRKK